MMIRKMLMLASMALALVAFAAPSVAQATVTLTDPDGTPLAKGDIFTATSTNFTITTVSGSVWCTHVQLHLEVITNGLNHVDIKQIGEATTSNCHLQTGGPSLPMTITDGTIGVGAGNKLTINTWGTGVTKTTMVTHIYGGIPHGTPTLLATCHFEGNVHVEATHPSPNDTLAFTSSKLTGAGAGCPAEGTVHGHFTMDTPNGKPVTLDFAATT